MTTGRKSIKMKAKAVLSGKKSNSKKTSLRSRRPGQASAIRSPAVKTKGKKSGSYKNHKNQINWMGLQRGDIVEVVAPGWATTPEILLQAENFLHSWGLVPRIAPDLLAPNFLGSNSQEYRVQSFKKALQNPDSKMIWCLRGGYGSIHLLPELCQIRRPRFFKMLWGISDITSLHGLFNQKWQWPTIHGPLLDRMAQGLVSSEYQEEVRQILFGEKKTIHFSSLIPLNSQARQNKKLHGEVVGGNLTVFQSLIGTNCQPSLRNKIVFFEDIGERAYRIDRMLEHLYQVGELQKARALIFGDFVGGLEKDQSNHIPELMEIWAAKLKFPVIKNLPAGHGQIQRPVPFLRPSVLSLGDNVELEIRITDGL